MSAGKTAINHSSDSLCPPVPLEVHQLSSLAHQLPSLSVCEERLRLGQYVAIFNILPTISPYAPRNVGKTESQQHPLSCFARAPLSLVVFRTLVPSAEVRLNRQTEFS